MKLSEKRVLFTKLLAELILWAHENKYMVAIDEAKRSQAQANANAASGKGISNSLHLIPLAADLVLYINGEYKTATSDYKVLGEKWESLHPLCAWGGRFNDGNHFSLMHEGRK